jgi:hypothetical protein
MHWYVGDKLSSLSGNLLYRVVKRITGEHFERSLIYGYRDDGRLWVAPPSSERYAASRIRNVAWIVMRSTRSKHR